MSQLGCFKAHKYNFLLNHFMPLVSFYIPWNQKTKNEYGKRPVVYNGLKALRIYSVLSIFCVVLFFNSVFYLQLLHKATQLYIYDWFFTESQSNEIMLRHQEHSWFNCFQILKN